MESEAVLLLQNGFSRRSVAQNSVYQSSQAYGRKIHGLRTAAVVRHAQQESWLNPSWRIRALSSSLRLPEVPAMVQPGPVAQYAEKLCPCTRCLSARKRSPRTFSGPRFPRRSGLHASSSQATSAVWRGGDCSSPGNPHAKRSSTFQPFSKTPRRKKGCAGPVPVLPVFLGAAHFLSVDGLEFSSYPFLFPRLCLSSGSLPA